MNSISTQGKELGTADLLLQKSINESDLPLNVHRKPIAISTAIP